MEFWVNGYFNTFLQGLQIVTPLLESSPLYLANLQVNFPLHNLAQSCTGKKYKKRLYKQGYRLALMNINNNTIYLIEYYTTRKGSEEYLYILIYPT